jgi:YD repeat-containing protein
MKAVNRFRVYYILICLLFYFKVISAQGVPNLVAPSPEASSILKYGNSNVNFYTGSPSLNIPIYTAKFRDASIPIALNYSSFGGVKVEEVASWVGLGWTLNAGGVVSRTIKGLPDDGPNGYQTLSAIPDLNNGTISIYMDYADGDYDGEPDQYYFNVNGLSGSFYINKSNQVVKHVKSDVEISPSFSGQVITSFEIVSTDGMKYVFSEKERSKSFELAENPAAITYYTTSWYLSEIKDQSGKTLITLNYYDFAGIGNELINLSYYPINEFPLEYGPLTDSDMKKSWTYIEAKRIKEIDFRHGKVLFNKSSTKRQDYRNDYWLDNVEIKDSLNKLVKKFVFDYSYFTTSGTASISSISTGITFQDSNTGDFQRRLRLNSLTEWDSEESNSLPPYEFTYNSNEYLPSRYSFAKDHWGYYNGETSNTGPEPIQKVSFFDAFSIQRLVGFGTANKEPSESHSKAGILTQVKYPTGGATIYSFEQHDAVEPKLTNDFSTQSLNFIPDGNWSITNPQINLINQPYQLVTVNVDASHQCSISVQFFETDGTTRVTGVDMDYISGPSIHSHGSDRVVLQPGTYKVKASIFAGEGCSGQITDNVELKWDNEVLRTNKAVGGLRISSILDHDGISSNNDIKREFFYNEDGESGSSNSTGRVVSVPKYGGQELLNKAASAPNFDMHPNGYRRTILPTNPLLTTNGSEVGYGKVTVKQVGSGNNGKSEYYFTTVEDYHDFYDGYYYSPLNGESYFSLPGIGSAYTFPFPQVDSRDYLRGLLTKQIDYKWIGSQYQKLREVVNEYVGIYDAPYSNLEPFDTNNYFISNSVAANHNTMVFTSVEGAVWKAGVHNHYKKYRIYSGKVDLQKSVTKEYDPDNESLLSETYSKNYWDDLADEHYQVSRIETQDSEGNVRETKMYYPYDAASLGLPTGNYTAMMGRNMKAFKIQEEQFTGGTKLATVRTSLEESNSYYLPNEVFTSKGAGLLEGRVEYVSYDASGNPREIRQKNGSSTVYLWGYGKAMPVAQIQNATWSDVSGIVSQAILDDLTKSDAEMRLELDKLRSSSALSNALITTTTYDPLVGVTSRTSPNGVTLYYEYDSFGRLVFVIDDDGNFIKKYQYEYGVSVGSTY